ncbi:Indigoidine synthase A like protein-domain-containing protein [Lasiosphaeria miniovina]|uniref:Indigoidine synthase A like protein-domain-containing protein n=1 Tax=Lasiosphaeria miniovina TaxID=1954250 RepID=A0AA40EE22_9PEZI|nr:Indigoidine synthase A like protein-domain-containing protein [Lasiosphaeria miniovina]KAK0734046.1 Indigoidine synthase A like protein-domain-containing protein [Lasiosphaeria miniovina]
MPTLAMLGSRTTRCARTRARTWPARLRRDSHRQYSGASQLGLAGILNVRPEVAHAVATNQPVVALESTIYTHGALGPLLLEDTVRQHGAVPAVCGILAGVPTVGLTPAEVDRMVHEGARKASRRDIAYVVGMGLAGQRIHAGTTIAGTMILARLAGIHVFGTGGLGGVHRGGHDSLDISADLTELGRTRVAVISSGCKGFLDIPRTLEFLETQGVLASTFADGRQGNVDFPAFWARDSGTKSPFVVQDERDAAAIIFAQEQLGVESGLLFANPIPQEHAISREDMDAAIGTAVREADEKGFSGAANTPYILKRIRELTDGRSAPANVALVQSNVARAAKVAVELSKLLDGKFAQADKLYTIQSAPVPAVKKDTAEEAVAEVPECIHATADILVAGSIALDLSCDFAGGVSARGSQAVSPALHTSNPASINQSVGGVGHNVALAAHKVSGDGKVRLCSMVGDDIAGSTILSALEISGLDTSYIRKLGHEYPFTRTAQYVAVNDTSKNLVVAMADMAIFSRHSFPVYWNSAVAASKPKWLVVDGNWAEADIQTWIQAGRKHDARIAFEPVSTAKSERLFPPLARDGSSPMGFPPHASVDLATPNQLELAAMHGAASRGGYFERPGWFEIIDAFGMMGARDRFVRLTSVEMTDAGLPVQTVQMLPYIPTIVTKLGERGALLTSILARDDPRLRDPDSAPYILTRSVNDHPHVGGVYMRLFPAVERVQDVVSVNGVGDTFLGVLIAGLAQGGRVENLINVAQKAAILSLRSQEAVSVELVGLARELEAAAAAS